MILRRSKFLKRKKTVSITVVISLWQAKGTGHNFYMRILPEGFLHLQGQYPPSVQLSSVAQSCLTLQPHGLQKPRPPVHHQLLEFTQTHVHWVSDAIQPSHPLSSLLLPSMFPNIRLFSNESFLHIWWPKYWSFSFNVSPMYILPWGVRKES